MIWRYNKNCLLHQWNDDVDRHFVFNALSGQTHVLNPLAMEVVELLKHQKLAEKVIVSQLANLYEDLDSNNAETYQHILNVLTSLDELGLIEPCSL